MDIRNKKGMTLIEILIVVALMGVLAGVMVRSMGDSMDKAKQGTAKTFVRDTLPGAIQLFNAQNAPSKLGDGSGIGGAADSMLTTLVNAGVIDSKSDPWGNDYILKMAGPDGNKYYAMGCIFNSKKDNLTDLGLTDKGTYSDNVAAAENLTGGSVEDKAGAAAVTK